MLYFPNLKILPDKSFKFCIKFVGFAFVYMEDERDADDAIRALDRTEFGRKGRRLRIELAKVL